MFVLERHLKWLVVTNGWYICSHGKQNTVPTLAALVHFSTCGDWWMIHMQPQQTNHRSHISRISTLLHFKVCNLHYRFHSWYNHLPYSCRSWDQINDKETTFRKRFLHGQKKRLFCKICWRTCQPRTAWRMAPWIPNFSRHTKQGQRMIDAWLMILVVFGSAKKVWQAPPFNNLHSSPGGLNVL